ncbi:hypothetical protein DFQ27_004264 [Actinomortierella ambigua]|uniref:YCII-related domain-containing protein n=1 Tax=Actinomortierella ambigua TaxID=1343610 RepID=A0A9P6QLR7_9FUNG|nr:hypothetical protein DFQ26_000469 [Actinomortierella ambigua]KAG0270552.1 hypothetical protein DFQ27_004264 [Actinomortierella ambigua]
MHLTTASRTIQQAVGQRSFSVSAAAASATAAKKQFLVVAWDHTDGEALNRRLSVRPAHMKGALELKESKTLQLGGAILTDHTENGKMKGSIMIFNADSEDEVRKLVEKDQYVVGKVWEKYDIYPFRTAPNPYA